MKIIKQIIMSCAIILACITNNTTLMIFIIFVEMQTRGVNWNIKVEKKEVNNLEERVKYLEKIVNIIREED